MTEKRFFRYKDHHRNHWLVVCELQDCEPGDDGQLWEISFHLDTDKPSRRGHHIFSTLERFEFPPEAYHIALAFARNWAAVSIGMAIDLQEMNKNGILSKVI